jgi:Outer membrane protein beta-barrel domain
MRLLLAVLVGTVAFGGVAGAQTPTQSAPPAAATAADKGYVEVVAQSATGNVTSQSFGVEAGVAILPRLMVFVEAGRTNDVSPHALGSAAQRIAGSLSQTLSNVEFTVKEPATFVAAGIRYSLLPAGESHIRPYVMAGYGLARLEKNVKFSVGGTDVTGNLSQAPYYVTLGTDLQGTSSSGMLVAGGGVTVPVVTHLIFDFQVRIGRILAEDEAITVVRAGAGIGVRF